MRLNKQSPSQNYIEKSNNMIIITCDLFSKRIITTLGNWWNTHLSQKLLSWLAYNQVNWQVSDIKISLDRSSNSNLTVSDVADQVMLAYRYAHSCEYVEANRYAL